MCRFSTNCEPLLGAARESFLPVRESVNSADFTIRFWVDGSDRAQPPWPKPYVRGLDHLVFAGFDAGSSLLADLRTRRVIGRFSAGMAADTAYLRNVVLPMVVTIVSASVEESSALCWRPSGLNRFTWLSVSFGGISGNTPCTLVPTIEESIRFSLEAIMARTKDIFFSGRRLIVALGGIISSRQHWGSPSACPAPTSEGRV